MTDTDRDAKWDVGVWDRCRWDIIFGTYGVDGYASWRRRYRKHHKKGLTTLAELLTFYRDRRGD